MIKDVTRGHIEFEFEGRLVTVPGEALLPGHGSPDFVVFSKMLTGWDPPYDGVAMDEATKARLLDALVSEMSAAGMRVEID